MVRKEEHPDESNRTGHTTKTVLWKKTLNKLTVLEKITIFADRFGTSFTKNALKWQKH
jgi:hypothetical protein